MAGGQVGRKGSKAVLARSRSSRISGGSTSTAEALSGGSEMSYLRGGGASTTEALGGAEYLSSRAVEPEASETGGDGEYSQGRWSSGP